MKRILLGAALVALLGACAEQPVNTAEANLDKEYRTGSNIPVRERDHAITASPESIEQQRNAATGNTGKRPWWSN